MLATGLADPFVVRQDDTYFLYGSHAAPDGGYLPVYRSRDLKEWTFVRGAVAGGGEGAWNRFSFWAPEVLFRDNRYWLYYTAASEKHPRNLFNRVGVAVADSPEGPFDDRGVLISHASLDASPFVDDDGSMVLLYVIEQGNDRGLTMGQIVADRLTDPLRVADDPRPVMTTHSWQEGPCMLKRFGRYYLFYSLGSWGKSDYRVVYAVGDSPWGPFEEQPGCFLESDGTVEGTGHHNFFQDTEGRDWTVYHGWDPAHTARYPHLGQVQWRDRAPRLSS